MLNNDRLLKEAAAFKKDASKEFDKAVKELIALAWETGAVSENFLWESDPVLDDKANAILRRLSESLAEKAKARAKEAIMEELDFFNFDEAWAEVEGEDYDSLLFRFDMQGSHLKDLLAIWIAIAAVHRIGKSELRILVSRYINNPYASPLWSGLPSDAIRWGRGYSRNILEQIAIIGQNAILGAARYAEWMDAFEKGAQYYIRRRGSSYDCDVCDDLANTPIPIDVPFEIPHSRCCCFAEYFFTPLV